MVRSRSLQRLPQPLQRLHLARAAQRYAAHGWPVVPGAALVGDRFDCGEPGCPISTCHPARPDWEVTASLERARIDEWWRRVSHGVLLATGHAFDALEVAGTAGWHLAREVRGPVAVAGQRWMFLVRPGGTPDAGLLERSNVVYHQAGSWIPAPPTPLPIGQVRWEVRPQRTDWRLPDPAPVQRAVARMLRFEQQQPPRVWPHLNAPLPARE